MDKQYLADALANINVKLHEMREQNQALRGMLDFERGKVRALKVKEKTRQATEALRYGESSADVAEKFGLTKAQAYSLAARVRKEQALIAATLEVNKASKKSKTKSDFESMSNKLRNVLLLSDTNSKQTLAERFAFWSENDWLSQKGMTANLYNELMQWCETHILGDTEKYAEVVARVLERREKRKQAKERRTRAYFEHLKDRPVLRAILLESPHGSRSQLVSLILSGHFSRQSLSESDKRRLLNIPFESCWDEIEKEDREKVDQESAKVMKRLMNENAT